MPQLPVSVASVVNNHLMHLDDTIVAIATPPGRGGIGVVRLSGSEATSIAQPMLRLAHADELAAEPRSLRRTDRSRDRRSHRRSGRHVLRQATLLYHRRRRRDFLPRLARRSASRGRDGAAARGASRRARRVHHARVPQRPHRPHPGRGRPRPYRLANALPGAGRGPPARGRVVQAAAAHQAEAGRVDRSHGSRRRFRRRRRLGHCRRADPGAHCRRACSRFSNCSPASPTERSCTKV